VQRTSDILIKVQEEGYEYLMMVEFPEQAGQENSKATNGIYGNAPL